MTETITPDRVVSAAKDLDKTEFTRADLATELDVKRPDLKDGLKQARKSGRVEKVGEDAEGTGLFRLTGE